MIRIVKIGNVQNIKIAIKFFIGSDGYDRKILHKIFELYFQEKIDIMVAILENDNSIYNVHSINANVVQSCYSSCSIAGQMITNGALTFLLDVKSDFRTGINDYLMNGRNTIQIYSIVIWNTRKCDTYNAIENALLKLLQ